MTDNTDNTEPTKPKATGAALRLVASDTSPDDHMTPEEAEKVYEKPSLPSRKRAANHELGPDDEDGSGPEHQRDHDVLDDLDGLTDVENVIGIGEAAGGRLDDCTKWSPKDVLRSVLREYERGERLDDPTRAIIVCELTEDNRIHYTMAMPDGTGGTLGLGILARTSALMSDNVNG